MHENAGGGRYKKETKGPVSHLNAHDLEHAPPAHEAAASAFEEAHEVYGEELAGAFLPDLLAEVARGDLDVLVVHAGDGLGDAWRGGLDERVDVLGGDGLAGVQRGAVVHPLPQLHPRDLGGRSVLHQMVDRHAAVTGQPRGAVRQRGLDVALHSVLRDLAAGDLGVQQVLGADFDLLAADVVLVGTVHVLVEDVHGDLADQRVRDPGAVVARGDFAELVGADFGHGGCVGLFVVLDGDLSGHASHRSDFAPIHNSPSSACTCNRVS